MKARRIPSAWVEKYRPKKLADCLLTPNIRGQVDKAIEKGVIPNLLLKGPAGTGKTSLAVVICEELGYEYMIVNGSNEGRLFDTLRSEIAPFAASRSLEGKRKAVIIDEADYIPLETVQPAMRGFFEEFHSNCTFILTCNFPNRIMDAIQSRCASIDFTMSPAERDDNTLHILKRTFELLNSEQVKYDPKVVAQLAKTYLPDFRRLLNELQLIASRGNITEENIQSHSDAEFAKLVEFVKDKNFKEMRSWVGSTANLDIQVIGRKLFDQANTIFHKDSIPQLVLHIADWQYKSHFSGDREIPIVAMITSIMADCETQ